MKTKSENLRWDPYFLREGAGVDRFWRNFLRRSKRNVLFVLGCGFDSRMCCGLERILNAGGLGIRDCLLIEFDEGPDSPSIRYKDYISKNRAVLDSLLKGRGQLFRKPVPMWSHDGLVRRTIGSRNAAEIFKRVTDFSGYSDIVIDISAMPRGIYFPLIGKVLHLIDSSHCRFLNLHVLVVENPEQDRKTIELGVDDAAQYMPGFGIELDMQATADMPKIWLPILGEGKTNQLERIFTLVMPDEICPILPFPSLDPRRADDILVESRESIFDQWRVEPRNIIFASEQNPFDVYRQIYWAVHHYVDALKPLGGCKAAMSAVCSKLLSLGALLATYKLKDEGIGVGLAHVEVQGYERPGVEDQSGSGEKLYSLWLAGECYDF